MNLPAQNQPMPNLPHSVQPNLLILYNPHYKIDVIKEHLEMLKKHGKVAFGKVVSKLNNTLNPAQEFLESLPQSVSQKRPLQLFLTDYANLFVAKVVAVSKEGEPEITPTYYKEKNFAVEFYFIITDLRELSGDFETIRDRFLANFTTPHYGEHTYAIYGNPYAYPLLITQKVEIDYFQSGLKHYPNVYKSPAQIALREHLATYCFGEMIEKIHIDSLEFLISAELELQENKGNLLYDFTSVVVKYSKIFELELHAALREFFRIVGEIDPAILDERFSIQGAEHRVSDIFSKRLNLGSYKMLINKNAVNEAIEKSSSAKELKNLRRVANYAINKLQPLRNQSVHQSRATFKDAQTLRNMILGINEESALSALVMMAEKLRQTKKDEK